MTTQNYGMTKSFVLIKKFVMKRDPKMWELKLVFILIVFTPLFLMGPKQKAAPKENQK